MKERDFDMFSDEQIANWMAWLATWYQLSGDEAQAHVKTCRGPASDLALALNLSPTEVARNLSQASLDTDSSDC